MVNVKSLTIRHTFSHRKMDSKFECDLWSEGNITIYFPSNRLMNLKCVLSSGPSYSPNDTIQLCERKDFGKTLF